MIAVMLALAVQDTEAKVDVKSEVIAVAIQKIENPEDRPLMTDASTTLMVKLTAGDWKLIDMDQSRCRLTAFTDDKGTDLLAQKPEWSDFVGSFPKFSADRSSCAVTLSSAVLPAAGARTLKAAGKLSLTVARGQDENKTDPIEFAAGTAFKVAGLPFEIESAAKSEWQEGKYEVSVTIKEKAETVASIKLLDADGNEVAFTEGGGWSGMGQRNQSFLLDAEMKQGRLLVTTWKETKEVDFALEVETGLGF